MTGKYFSMIWCGADFGSTSGKFVDIRMAAAGHLNPRVGVAKVGNNTVIKTMCTLVMKRTGTNAMDNFVDLYTKADDCWTPQQIRGNVSGYCLHGRIVNPPQIFIFIFFRHASLRLSIQPRWPYVETWSRKSDHIRCYSHFPTGMRPTRRSTPQSEARTSAVPTQQFSWSYAWFNVAPPTALQQWETQQIRPQWYHGLHCTYWCFAGSLST